MSVVAAGCQRRDGFARSLACLAALLGCACVTPEAYPPGPVDYPGWREEGQLHLGTRNFSDLNLMPSGDDQFVMGVELYGAPEAALFSIEFAFWASAPYDGSLDDWFDSISGFPDEESDETTVLPTVTGSSSIEASMGLRKEFLLAGGFFRPYVSTGLSVLRARSFVASGAVGVEEGDTTWGWYGQVGVMFALSPYARVGIGLRAFEGEEVELLGVRGEPDYQQLTFTLGFSY